MWGVTCCQRCSNEYRRFLDAKFMPVVLNAEKQTFSVFTRVGLHSPPEESTHDQVEALQSELHVTQLQYMEAIREAEYQQIFLDKAWELIGEKQDELNAGLHELEIARAQLVSSSNQNEMEVVERNSCMLEEIAAAASDDEEERHWGNEETRYKSHQWNFVSEDLQNDPEDRDESQNEREEEETVEEAGDQISVEVEGRDHVEEEAVAGEEVKTETKTKIILVLRQLVTVFHLLPSRLWNHRLEGQEERLPLMLFVGFLWCPTSWLALYQHLQSGAATSDARNRVKKDISKLYIYI